MAPVIYRGSGVDQTDHKLLVQALRTVLVDGAGGERGAAGGMGSDLFRACAALYGLLLDHPIDEWGRCRSCRRPGLMFGARWQACRVGHGHRPGIPCCRFACRAGWG
ncbi:MAG: hypothetical protein WCF33_12730 [Pseudonocardiaceae bacterium]